MTPGGLKICEHPACEGKTFFRPIGSHARECPKHDRTLKIISIVKTTPAQQWAMLSELIH